MSLRQGWGREEDDKSTELLVRNLLRGDLVDQVVVAGIEEPCHSPALRAWYRAALV